MARIGWKRVLKTPAQIAGVAVLYIVTAKFGFLFSPPPGNVAPIWIPSGIALAALLWIGWRGALGVWLGSFAVNLETLGASAGEFAVAGAIALGSTLQAALAAWLFWRFVLERRGAQAPAAGPGRDLRIERRAAAASRVIDSVRPALYSLGVLLLASPLAATTGVTSLCTGGYAPWSEFAPLWRTWWLGDLAGFLVVGPPAVMATRVWRLVRSPHADPVYPVVALIFLGLAITGWSLNSLRERQAYVDELNADASAIGRQLENLLGEQFRYGATIVALFRSSAEVTRTEFSIFAERILEKDHATQALSYLARVPGTQKAAWQERARREGVATYAIRERDKTGAAVPAGERAEHFPVHYIYPLRGNEAAIGFDIYSDPSRRVALERARDSGLPAVTEPIRLVQEQGSQAGFLIFHPIYGAGTRTETLEDRRENLVGFSSIVVKPQQVLDKELTRQPGTSMQFAIFDTGAGSVLPAVGAPGAASRAPATLIASSAVGGPTELEAWRHSLHASRLFELAGRQHLLVVRPLASHPLPLASLLAWLWLALGFATAGAILLVGRAHYVLNVARAREHGALERRVEERTSALAAATAAAKRSETLLRSAIDTVDEAFVVYDEDDRLLLSNQRYRDFYSISADLLVSGARFEDIIREGVRRGQYPKAAGREEAWIAERMAAHRSANSTVEQQLSGGRWLRITERRTPEGLVVGLRSDITVLKEAEALARSAAESTEQQFRDTVAAMAEAFISVNERGRIREWSGAAESMFGWARSEALGKELAELIVPPQHREAHRKGMQRALQTGGQTSLRRAVELTALRRDGSEFPVNIRLFSEPTPGGARVFGFVQDISARVRAISELQHSEARYRSLTESTSAAIFRQQGMRILEANAAACRITGYSLEELRALDLQVLLDPEFHAAYQAKMRKSLAREDTGIPIEIRIRRKDGTHRWLSVTNTLQEISAGRTLLATAIDVTERRHAEEKLSLAQKMEAIGQLTGGLAHDFNNLLGVIVGNLDLLGAAVAGNERMKKRVDTALGAALRGSGMTQQLLAVARRQSLSPEPVDLVAHLRAMLPLLHTTVGSGIQVKDQLGDVTLFVKVDLGGLDSAVLNLVVNARDAMRGQGDITLSAMTREADRMHGIDASMATDATMLAVLAVSDNGPGMVPAVRARAFEPFFTTKDRSRGTGLGLAMVHGFCRQSGGDAYIYSEPGYGTTVRLFLPLAQEAGKPAAGPATTGAAESTPPRGTERVLLVDDEIELLEVNREWLQDLGYVVGAYADPQEALAALAAGAYELLVTDVVMPKLSGFELAARARKRQPGLALLYVSGFADESQAGISIEHAELLQKPYTKAYLARAARRALDKTGAAQAAQPKDKP